MTSNGTTAGAVKPVRNSRRAALLGAHTQLSKPTDTSTTRTQVNSKPSTTTTSHPNDAGAGVGLRQLSLKRAATISNTLSRTSSSTLLKRTRSLSPPPAFNSTQPPQQKQPLPIMRPSEQTIAEPLPPPAIRRRALPSRQGRKRRLDMPEVEQSEGMEGGEPHSWTAPMMPVFPKSDGSHQHTSSNNASSTSFSPSSSSGPSNTSSQSPPPPPDRGGILESKLHQACRECVAELLSNGDSSALAAATEAVFKGVKAGLQLRAQLGVPSDPPQVPVEDIRAMASIIIQVAQLGSAVS